MVYLYFWLKKRVFQGKAGKIFCICVLNGDDLPNIAIEKPYKLKKIRVYNNKRIKRKDCT